MIISISYHITDLRKPTIFTEEEADVQKATIVSSTTSVIILAILLAIVILTIIVSRLHKKEKRLNLEAQENENKQDNDYKLEVLRENNRHEESLKKLEIHRETCRNKVCKRFTVRCADSTVVTMQLESPCEDMTDGDEPDTHSVLHEVVDYGDTDKLSPQARDCVADCVQKTKNVMKASSNDQNLAIIFQEQFMAS